MYLALSATFACSGDQSDDSEGGGSPEAVVMLPDGRRELDLAFWKAASLLEDPCGMATDILLGPTDFTLNGSPMRTALGGRVMPNAPSATVRLLPGLYILAVAGYQDEMFIPTQGIQEPMIGPNGERGVSFYVPTPLEDPTTYRMDMKLKNGNACSCFDFPLPPEGRCYDTTYAYCESEGNLLLYAANSPKCGA